MTLLLALMIFTMALTSQVRVSYVSYLSPPPGVCATACMLWGWTDCHPEIHVHLVEHPYNVLFNEHVAQHEWAHAADCADNGMLDGSPMPVECVVADCAHAWVYWCLDAPTRCLERLTVNND